VRCESEKIPQDKVSESTDLSQRLIHGEVCTEVCKVAVGAFVLAISTPYAS